MKPAAQINKKHTKKGNALGLLCKLLFFLLLSLFSTSHIAFAAVEITDVMYDPPGSDKGREWIEVTNKGTESTDISKFKLLEGGVKHGLTRIQGDAVLAVGDKATIAVDPATFLSEHAGFAGPLFKSSFSLSNTGETLAIINSTGGVENSLTYTAPLKAAVTPKAKASSSKKPTTKTASSTSYAAAVGDSFDTTDKKNSSLLPWVTGLGGIIVLGVAGVLLVPKRIPSLKETELSADEFEIE